MTQNPRRKIDVLRERIQTSDVLSERDRENLIAFSDRMDLLRSEYSDATHHKNLESCARMAGVSPNVPDEEMPEGALSAVLDDREEAERVVRWINQRYDNEESNAGFRRALRVFAKQVTDGDDVPETVSWVPTGYSDTYDPAPNPGEMLHWEEGVLDMIDACRNPRDEALIAVGFDAGPRGGEMVDLAVGDVADHSHGLQITVHGKQGQRTVTLIPSVPYLQQWLQAHPAGNDPDAPLWSKLSKPEKPTYETLWKALDSAADRAGITKPVNFTALRKSSASYLASSGMNQAHLEDHHGWVRGSKRAARYVAVFGDEADNELARIHGLDVGEDDQEEIGPVTCPRCNRETPRHEEFCVWCNQAVEPGAVETLDEQQRQVNRDALRLARENPELLDEAERRQEIVAALADDPSLFERAQEFVDVTD